MRSRSGRWRRRAGRTGLPRDATSSADCCASRPCAIGGVGLLRFPDFYMRLHAPTKASTLGVGGVLLASLALSWLRGEPGLHELLITLFVFITAPVSANLMAMAALHLRVPSTAPVPPGQPLD